MEKNYCTICNEEITEKNKSVEHIIPNAIGGILKSDKLFCKKCNNKFGTDVDSNFTKIFSFIDSSVEIRKDRKSSGTVSNGYIYTENGILVEGKIKGQNISYFEDGKHKTIKKRDLPFLAYKINIDKKALKKGFGKIAFDYALYCGIDINQINKIFDANEKQIIEDYLFIPFVPLNIFDKKIEEAKNYELKHSLRLFSCQNFLFCYIELFSTFQYYVLLSDSYSGPLVYNDFSQKTSVKEKNIDFSINRQKDILLYVKKFNLDIKKISEQCNNDIDLIAKEVSRQAKNKYDSLNNELSYEKEITNLIDPVLLAKLKKNENDFLSFSKLYYYYTYESKKDFLEDDLDFICERSINMHKFQILNYNLQDNILELYPFEIYEKIIHNKDFPKDYCYMKFNLLKDYINRHPSNEKEVAE